METLRKLSSMGRSKESKEAATIAVEKEVNGEENSNNTTVVPSPPRARVSDEDVEEVAGDDDGYDSAVEKIGTSSTPSVVEETVAAAPEATMSFAQALQQHQDEEIETEEVNGDGNPIQSFSNDEEPSSSHSEEEEEEEEEDEELSRQVSIRAMPVAKLTTEEQEEDVDEDDEEEVDNEEYEEANDQVLAEEDNTAAAGDALPRIIARETADDQFDVVDDSSTSSLAVDEEVEQAASTPLPDQFDDQVEKSITTEEFITTEEISTSSPPVEAEEETVDEDIPSAVSNEEDEEAVKEEHSSSNVVEKFVEEDSSSNVLENFVDEDSSSNVVENFVEEETNVREDDAAAAVVGDEEEAVPESVEETELSQATSSLAEPAPVDIGVKEDVAPEVVPLESGKSLKENEVEETEQAGAAETISRGASSSLLEELRKLSASRSLREQSVVSEPAIVTETTGPADEPSQSTEEKEEESTTVSEPVTVIESKYSASNSLLDELKKLSDARLQREAREKNAEETTTISEQKEHGTDSSVSKEPRVVDQKVVDVGEGVTPESLDELKELTYGFHLQGTSESDASEVQTVSFDSTAKDSSDSTSTVAVTEKISPEVAEVQIVEDRSKPEEAGSATVKEEVSKEDVEEGPAAVPSPAKLFTVLNAVDGQLPASKAENGNVVETETVQVKPRGFSAADFTGADGDSDADAEDDEDDDDDDDDDEDQDETDMDTAKALAELANAVGKSGNGSESGKKPSMGTAGPSLPSLPQRPAARKSAAATALDTAGRITQRPAVTSSTQLTTTADESANGETAEGNETREKLQNIRVKFLRLAHRLGQSPQNVVVAQVLYRLGLAESLRGGSAPNRTGAFSFDRANTLAEEQEAANQEEELDFACTILVLGKTGVGKSATINSIFDDRKSVTSAFKPSTNKVQEIVGTVHGIKVRVIDTPGLLPSVADQQHNERIMGQVKKHIKKASPDIVLYFDRLDMQSRDYGDLPLLRTITDLFGAAVWFNAIVVLTHASSAPPDGPNGVPLSYEMFVAQRSHVVQQTIRQAAGDMRLMNPVSLVENHPACRTNRNGQRVLPNGQIWKPQLLLLCFASKILAEANSLLKLQETATPGRPFGQRSRVPPLPFLLSSLLQSRAQLKLPDEQLGESDESDDDEEEEDSDADDYDELPPFRPLSKEELEELDKEQRQDYLDEIADRERLFQKKQYREEMRRRKEMKKRAAQMSKEELAQPGDEADDEAGKAAAVPVPMPDMALPPSFDSDNPTHRYRYLETANQWLVRPVLETHGWDHDAGYDGFNVEKMFVVKDKVPASISGQVTKDKKEAQVNFEAAASLKHGEGKVTLTGFDIQTIGKDLAYTLRAETRFNNFKRNKTTAGLTCTVLNDTIAAGLKLEDRILIGKRIKMVVNGGVLTGKGDKAFGGSLEATLRGKEYPLSRTLSTLGLSVMDWHGDLAIGGNLQSQFMVGKTMMVGRANLNNRGSGQVSIRASSSEQLQMVLIGIVPILRSLINCRFGFGGQSSQ